MGDAETQQDQQDVSEEEGELRDRGKARKFQKLKDAGPIPDHILAMFEHESKKQDKPRSYKTALINRLFKPDGKGGYECSVLASQFLNPKTHLVLQARGQHGVCTGLWRNHAAEGLEDLRPLQRWWPKCA